LGSGRPKAGPELATTFQCGQKRNFDAAAAHCFKRLIRSSSSLFLPVKAPFLSVPSAVLASVSGQKDVAFQMVAKIRRRAAACAERQNNREIIRA
jgi:hypothetical protein